MGNVIELREKHIENIENKASEMFGAVKLGDNSYIIPSNVVKSTSIDKSYLESDLYQDEKLRKEVSELVFNDKEYISITCKKIMNNNIKLLEIVRLKEDMDEDNSIIELEVKSNLAYDDREHLLNMIADVNNDKEVYLTFYIHYDFNLLEGLVSED